MQKLNLKSTLQLFVFYAFNVVSILLIENAIILLYCCQSYHKGCFTKNIIRLVKGIPNVVLELYFVKNHLWIEVLKIEISNYLSSIICPTAKLHNTSLFIEWKVFNIHLTRGMIDSRWFPFNLSIIQYCRFCGQCYFKVSISTVKNEERREMKQNMQ